MIARSIYHPGKANIVADVLKRKLTVELADLRISQPHLIKEFAGMGLEIMSNCMLAHLTYLMV
jgi:hypothetical protein